MLYDENQRVSLINKVMDQLHNAQKEADKLAGFGNGINSLNKKLIDFCQEVIELWKKAFNQRDYILYKERLQLLIGMCKNSASRTADSSRSKKPTRKPSKQSSENDPSNHQQSKSKLFQEKASFEQKMQSLKEEDFSDISFASLTSSNSATLQEIIDHSEKNQGYCSVHNCRELKIMREIFRQKIDINELQLALEEITALKSQIRMKLQKELQKISEMHNKLIESQRKLQRLEEFEREQEEILMQKKIILSLE